LGAAVAKAVARVGSPVAVGGFEGSMYLMKFEQ
jgi:hypothetical protein